jgi:2-haloacid dehalogenase
MRYQQVLFDADDTLFDFGRSERHAFAAFLDAEAPAHPLPAPREALYGAYQQVNVEVWRELEQGLLSNAQLNPERFRRFWAAVGREVEPAGSGERYLEHLSRCSFLLEGARETCQRLREELGCRVGIVTNGFLRVQRARLAGSELAAHVDFMVVSEECGFAKPDPRILAYTFERHGRAPPGATLLVGDRLGADVQVAHAYGVDSCWFNPGRRANPTHLRPTHEVHALADVVALVAAGP